MKPNKISLNPKVFSCLPLTRALTRSRALSTCLPLEPLRSGTHTCARFSGAIDGGMGGLGLMFFQENIEALLGPLPP